MTDPAHHSFVRTLARSLRQRCGIRGGEHLLLAVSGGADSVALLRAMAMLGPRRRFQLRLTVAHVQHHLRDADGSAERDAAFVADLCDRMQLPCLRRDIEPALQAGNVEAHARRLRYSALVDMACEVGTDLIATGHHADDQLETLLMRLLRGSSFRGLAGMRHVRSLAGGCRLIRPMLGSTHAAGVDFLRSIDQPWREDHTNTDTTRLRAKLRQSVLPTIAEALPQASARAVQLGEQLHAMSRLLGKLARQLHEAASAESADSTLRRDVLAEADPLVVMQLLRGLLAKAGVPRDRLPRRTLTAMTRAIADGRGGERTFALARGVSLVVEASTVRVKPPG